MFVDLASLHNLVNKANLVHNLFLVCLFLSTFINLYMFRRNSCVYPTVVSPVDVHSHPKHVEIDKKKLSNKHTENKLCTKLALLPRLCSDARSKNIKFSFENNRLSLWYTLTTIYSTVIVKSNEVTGLVLIYLLFLTTLLYSLCCVIIPLQKKEPNLNVSTNIPSIYTFVLPNFMQAHVIKF